MNKAAFVIYLLLACNAVLAARSVQPFSADYRLLFNGEHVGNARFSLKLTPGNQYSFEAITHPAGKMAVDNSQHEVLEASNGRLQSTIPVPDHYYTAVKTGQGTTTLEFFYDWQTMTLIRKDGNGQQKTKLRLHSQDRLSYLLRAMKLVNDHKNSIIVPLLTDRGTKHLSIRKKNRRHINTAAGRVLAMELELKYEKKPPVRSLWLSLDQNCLPVLLEQITDTGTVRMELLRIL